MVGFAIKYRPLGKTGLEISEISIGTEWLYKKKEEDIKVVIQEAIKQGVNYFDTLFNFESYLEQISAAFQPYSRDKVILVHHLGSSEYKGKYKKTRSVKKCREHFDRFLEIMKIDRVDIVFIHFVHTQNDFDKVWKEGGVKDLAVQLQEEGKTRFIGVSTHHVEHALKFAESGIADVIMIQINLANHSHPKRQELLDTCASKGIGVIAMKPFAGGKLLQANQTVSFAKYQTASHTIGKKKIAEDVTSAKCLHYLLNLVGLSAVVPGVANLEELHDCLSYYSVSEEEKDYSGLLKDFEEYVTGECVYCNHCQPCQADIDIGPMIRLYDRATLGSIPDPQKEYETFEAKASDCIECGECLERCPFEVDAIAKMKEIATFFGK
ncbi:MAG: hypothetical protein GF308_02960 [Candidatus Heimdallarchaeota archaeon]|nr:hypothetical protein [Candidatus Heimdallarchaeota archaeon]